MKSKRIKSEDNGIIPRILYSKTRVSATLQEKFKIGATYNIGVYGSTSMKRVSSMTVLEACTSLLWHSSGRNP